MRIGGATVGIARGREAFKRGADGVADVEALAGAAEVALAKPLRVPTHLVLGVEALPFDQAGRQAQRHRRVIGPLAGFEAERPAADHVGQRLKGPARLELDGRADGVAHRQAEETTLKPIAWSG